MTTTTITETKPTPPAPKPPVILPLRIATEYGEAWIARDACVCCDKPAECLAVRSFAEDDDETTNTVTLCRDCIQRLFDVSVQPAQEALHA